MLPPATLRAMHAKRIQIRLVVHRDLDRIYTAISTFLFWT